MSGKRFWEQVAVRRQELKGDTQQSQAAATRGKHMTDDSALRRPSTKHAESAARRAPRHLARAQQTMFRLEQQSGLELEAREVAGKVTQDDILQAADEQTRRKKFDVTLDKLGPYRVTFSHNGAHMALCGLRGHLATMNWRTFNLEGETQLKDKCTDATYLVDNSMLAVAQKRFCYMYTSAGVELHVLPSFANMDKLAYLRNHMLLVGASSQYSVLGWMDVSTGDQVSTKPPAAVKDPVTCLQPNRGNGIIGTGDTRGVVKLWSPTVDDALVQLKAHKGPIKAMKFHPNGRFLATLGVENKLKLWDCRTLRPLDEYATNYAFDCMDISDKGLLALAGGPAVQVWKDLFSGSRNTAGPHLLHSVGYGNVASNVAFCPFEDVLAVGHARGVSTMLVPGAGEANPDIFNANPYETVAHRKDRVVTNLLDKLPLESISLDLKIAGVDETALTEYNEKMAKMQKQRGIRDKKRAAKQVRENDAAAETTTGLPQGAAMPSGLDLEEELEVKEQGTSKLWKTKAEKKAESKKRTWDNKDSSDKVRSKQKMRHSNMVRKEKWKKTKENILGPRGPATDAEKGEGEGAVKKQRKPKPDADGAPAKVVDPSLKANAAFRRLLS